MVMAGVGFSGRKHSEETKAHWSKIRKGRPALNKGVYHNIAYRASILVSPENKDLLESMAWHNHDGYPSTYINGKRRRLHQLILEVPAGYMVDHINGNPLDNRRSNLRIATSMTNQQNRKVGQKNNTSGFKGVSWHSTKRKWHANIRVNKVLKHLGYYEEATQAAKAYNQAALTYFGSYAQLNEISNGTN